MTRSFRRLFIANRGEVAARVAKSCDVLGITPVFAVSEADQHSPWVRDRETVVLGGSRSSESYLHMERVIQAAVQSRCTALHPGWGFLAENTRFATLCETHGVTFIGPPAHVMERMGRKSPAKDAMRQTGLRLIPGSNGVLKDVAEAEAIAESIGFPVLIKAESGGGGKGMRIARSKAEVAQAYGEASAEARAAFGDPRVFLEKLIEGGRHIEIQIMADRHGDVVHVGERDCTVQRNHQKLIEESPSPMLSDEERARTLEAAVEAARSIGYVGAGTMEFLLDENDELRFMEMNTRLQVEHTVSEMRAGIDLVAEQIRVAAGHALSLSQDAITLEGHTIECRINAEDPYEGFRPSPGVLEVWSPPAETSDLRVDSHVEQGYEVPPFYDSMLCKVITKGANRDEACDRMIDALRSLKCEGVKTTIPMHLEILANAKFRAGEYDTRAIPGFTGNKDGG